MKKLITLIIGIAILAVPINVYADNLQKQLISCPDSISVNMAFNDMAGYPYTHPDVFWVYSFNGSGSNDRIDTLQPLYIVKKDKLSICIKRYNKALNKSVRYVNKGKTVAEKYRRANNYLVKNCKYKSAELTTCKTAYGALVTGYADCRGFALGYKAICQKARLPCKVVVIPQLNWTYNGHVLNKVKLNGKWWYVDVSYNNNNHNDIFMDNEDFTRTVLGGWEEEHEY